MTWRVRAAVAWLILSVPVGVVVGRPSRPGEGTLLTRVAAIMRLPAQRDA